MINDSALARGGATALAIECALGAAKAGWQVTFFSRKNNTPDVRLIENGVRICGVDGQKVSGASPAKAFVSGIWNANAKRALEQLIAEHDMANTVVHIHNWAHFLSPSIFKPLQPFQDRTIMSTHDFFLSCGNGGQFNYRTRTPCHLTGNSKDCLSTRCDKRNSVQKMWRVARHRTRKQLLNASEFTGTVALVHNKQKSFLENAGFKPDHIQEIRNPVTGLVTERVKAEDNKSILFIGRLDVEKGADVAAKAAELAGAEIVFAGEGPLKDAIRRDYKNAKLMGFCDRKKLAELITDARFLIMPSWLETFGLAAVESLWSGVPVLMSQNALLSSDIVERQAGRSIDPGDIQSVSETIKALMSDDIETKRMSENAFYRSADIANTPETWNRAHLEIYEKALAPATKTQIHPQQNAALLNVHYSANLGDGLLSDCLAFGLKTSAPELTCFPVDLAGRESITTLGGSKRGVALKVLTNLPAPARRGVITLLQKHYMKKLWRPHYSKMLNKADCVVVGGGNLIVDQDLNFPVKISAALETAHQKGLPVHIYGVGVGAKFSDKALRLFRTAFSECDLQSVTVRDEASRQNWDKFFAPHCGHSAEIVFDPGIVSTQCWPSPEQPSQISGPIDCAIGIMSPNELNYHNEGDKFVDLHTWYLSLIEHLQSHGKRIVLFSNGSPEDTHYIESKLAPNLQGVDIFIPKDHEQLCNLVSNAKSTIAFRLHAVIPATSYGNHVIALEWDKKIRSFMTLIGKPDQSLNVREVDAADAAQKCLDLLKQPLPSNSHAKQAAKQMSLLATRIRAQRDKAATRE